MRGDGFDDVDLPSGSHDWFITEDGHREIWACFQSQHYMAEEIARFERNNPGMHLELMESTINLRFRIVEDENVEVDPRVVASVTELE